MGDHRWPSLRAGRLSRFTFPPWELILGSRAHSCCDDPPFFTKRSSSTLKRAPHDAPAPASAARGIRDCEDGEVVVVVVDGEEEPQEGEEEVGRVEVEKVVVAATGTAKS